MDIILTPGNKSTFLWNIMEIHFSNISRVTVKSMKLFVFLDTPGTFI